MSRDNLYIGKLLLKNNVILAPMAGISNSAYRQINIAAGAALVYSEMVSANGLIRAGARTRQLLERSTVEKPFAVQLFGAEAEVLATAARIASDYGEMIDLNMGCPVKKVVRSGAGSALLQDITTARNAIRAIRRATDRPFTVKIRSGWDHDSENFLAIGAMAADEGVDAVILHPRPRSQGFAGHANWQHIAALKQRISIPVIGSGDIFCAADAIAMLQQTGCDAVMIGRGGYGNPWLIRDILLRQQGHSPPAVTPQQRLKTALRHLELHRAAAGEKKTVLEMRKHLCWYARGLGGASEFRARVNRCTTTHQLTELARTFFMTARPATAQPTSPSADEEPA